MLDKDRWEDFRELRLEALKKEPTAFGRTYEEEAELSKNKWINSIKDYIFAIDNDQMVGMIGYKYSKQPKCEHNAEIVHIYVQEEYRGSGIGYELLKEILKTIYKKNFKKIKVAVNAKQKAALRLYKKFGFRVVGVFEKDMKNTENYDDVIFLEKLL